MKSAAAIAFDYRFSRWLVLAVLAVALLAMLSLRLSALTSGLQLLIAVSAAAHAAWCVRLLMKTPRRLAWHEAGHWRVADADGTEHVAELDHAVARAGWIVLRLRRSDGLRFHIVLGPDNCGADVRRRLRVRLARGLGEAGA